MRSRFVDCVALVIPLTLPAALHAAPLPECDRLVAGGAAADVAEAVNDPHAQGRVTVCLRGVFDFGEAGTVLIDPPPGVTRLTLVGLDFDGRRTTFRGGRQPLKLGASSLPVLRIQNLAFDGPAGNAISVLGSHRRLEIEGVVVDGVTSASLPELAGPVRIGILVLSVHPVEGEVRITGSTLRGGAYDLRRPADVSLSISAGILLRSSASPFTAAVVVDGNLVADWSGVGIFSSGPDGVLITDNFVAPGEISNRPAVPFVCQGTGIAIAGCVGCLVKRNVIDKVPAVTGDLQEPYCTVGLSVSNETHQSAFVDNRISGEGHVALDVVPPGAGPATRNVFLRNDLDGFAAYLATVGLGRPDLVFGLPAGLAEDNLVAGSEGTVVGNVAGNTVIGLTEVP